MLKMGDGTTHSSLSVESLSLEERTASPLAEETDPGEEWNTDLDDDETENGCPDTSPAELYQQACRLVGVVPVTYFLRNLGNATMNLNHHGLGPLGVKALAIALVTDTEIRTLELEDNYLLAEGARYLVEMLKANFTIQNLNLSNNHLRSAGAEYISKTLLDNISLRAIRLSGNGFIEDDAKDLADALASNYRVKELDLSHNEFCAKGGEHLGQMLANNEGLEMLDLSWNQLRMKGAVALCAGLKVNVTLKHLDLSWNGFGNEGALALGEALKFNNTLVHLDLSYNRITNEGAAMLCKGLEANDTLQVLRLAFNGLTVEGALALLKTVKNSPKSALEEINISNVLVDEDFVQLLDLTCLQHPGLEVHYRGVGGFIAKKPPRRPDPMKVIQVKWKHSDIPYSGDARITCSSLLQDYLDERKLRLWDFFRNIDKDGTMRVPVSDFRKAVQQSSIPLDRNQIEELIQRLDKERTGIVDYRGLADTRKQMMRDHRRQQRKAESRQKKETQKSERILRTFQSAVEAVTPRGSVVMSPGPAREDSGSGGPSHFSATPLSSWHHAAATSHSSRYSVTNLSTEYVHLPPVGGASCSRPPSSPAVRSHSQPNLSAEKTSDQTGPASPQGARSNPDVTPPKLSPTANLLTRSRPALITKQQRATRTKKQKSKKRADKTTRPIMTEH